MFSSFLFISTIWLFIATLSHSQRLADESTQPERSSAPSKVGEPCSFVQVRNRGSQEVFKCVSGLTCVITTIRPNRRSGICDRVDSNIKPCNHDTCKIIRRTENTLCIGEDNLTFRCSTVFPIRPTPPPCGNECTSVCRNSGPGKSLVACSVCLASERSKRPGCSIM